MFKNDGSRMWTHCTSRSNAKLIKKNGFRCGSVGMAGGGDNIFNYIFSKLEDSLYIDIEYLCNICKYSTILPFMYHDKIKSIHLNDIIITHTVNRPNIIKNSINAYVN